MNQVQHSPGARENPPGRSSGPAADSASLVPLSLDALIQDHYQTVFRYAYRLCGSVPDAEDLCQQTFLAAQRALHQVREAEKADRWLFAVTRNAFLKSRMKVHPVHASHLELDVDQVAETHAAPDLAETDALQSALGQLPEEFRVVVLMFYFEQRSYLEIADALQVSPGTVMSRLSRAKEKLRRILGEEAAPRSAHHDSSAAPASPAPTPPHPTRPWMAQ